MIQIRPANERGHADNGWLNTWHSFSFADYYDPQEMGWGVLRVINDDVIAPGKGFGMHSHRDMEIVTYVLSGELEHKDSMDNGEVIKSGEVQRMSAGSGVLHSEFNPSSSLATHLLQIWLLPNEVGGTPAYEQKTIDSDLKRGRLQPIATNDGRQGSVSIRQNAAIYASMLAVGELISYDLVAKSIAYVHVISGSITINSMVFGAADGAKIAQESRLDIAALTNAEFLLFDLGLPV